MNYALDIVRAITLALNGSESLFWDNLMVCVTNTFSWSLVIVMLLYIFFHNNTLRDAFIILLTIGLMILVADRLCSGLVKPWVQRITRRPYPQVPSVSFVIRSIPSSGASQHRCTPIGSGSPSSRRAIP